jgi:hypothetical protein
VPLAEVTDGGAEDFAAGSADAGTHLAPGAGGAVMLRPTAAGEFGGPAIPDGWRISPWLEGGTGTLDGGMLVLDGARVGCDALHQSPRSIEISAVLASRPDQHIGLGTNFVDVPWVMFSTKWGRRLYARTHLLNVEDKRLAGDWFDGRHVFRIDWNVLDVVFSVDGERLAQFMVPVPGHMRGMAANQRLGGAPLRVEWIRISPYAPAGRFTSRPFDGGTRVRWATATWEADVPDATTLAVEVRTGDGPSPDDTWSPWKAVAASGGPVGATSRYLQYRVDLATTDRSRTPVLRRMSVRYRPAQESSSSSGAT